MYAPTTFESSGSSSRIAASTSAEYDYESPAADFRCRLVFDASGFVLDYPGIATRVV